MATSSLTRADIDEYVENVENTLNEHFKDTMMDPVMNGINDNKRKSMEQVLAQIDIKELVKFDAEKLKTILITKGKITGGASRIRSSRIGDKSGSARGKTTSLVDIVAKAKSRHETRTRK
ncbi:MAG: hypothetical protein ABEI52_03070 [Halobacteriaceae archaeon]